MTLDIRSLTRVQLGELCRSAGWEPYRSRQIYSWLWQKRATHIAEMSNLPLRMRDELARSFHVRVPPTIDHIKAPDGTARLTFQLEDGSVVESVYIPELGRRTACISTQVGCALGCRICNTAKLGFTRDLAWHEIAGQALEVNRGQPDRLTNIVFMGMGEPLANYEATMTAIEEINSHEGLGIGARRITVSTAGLPDGIRRYARCRIQSRLAVSLNAADDATRDRLMPINRRYPLAELLSAVREFTAVRGKRVTFEYVLLRGINDRPGDARNLTALLQGIPCKVNLIPFNTFPDCGFTAPHTEEVERFARDLYPHLPAVTIRRSRGAAICAACGQLAARPLPDST